MACRRRSLRPRIAYALSVQRRTLALVLVFVAIRSLPYPLHDWYRTSRTFQASYGLRRVVYNESAQLTSAVILTLQRENARSDTVSILGIEQFIVDEFSSAAISALASGRSVAVRSRWRCRRRGHCG